MGFPIHFLVLESAPSRTNFHIEVYTCWWRRMMVVVPFTGMMVVMIVIMGFVATRHRQNGQAENNKTEDFFHRTLHMIV
jgi:glycerol-3-phosphate acyltransferase PlsY